MVDAKKLFDLESLVIGNVISSLYDFSKPGGLSIPNFILPEFRQRLLNEVRTAVNLFREAPREYGKALQEMDILYIGEADEDKIQGNFPEIQKLVREYSRIYKRIGNNAGFNDLPNSVGIHRYKKDSLGLTPHLDHTWYINLISVFVLEGKAPFYVCSDREKTNSVELESSPGSLILLRAPRSKDEEKYRPMHYLDRVVEERYAVIIRQYKEPKNARP